MSIKGLLLIISMGLFVQGFAQQQYFVFIRSENDQPFYVRLDERNLSSSSIGHIILPKLKDSTYSIVIGFPKAQFPEQEFSIAISRKDRGFELKNLGDKGWVLFDVQTMQLINAKSTAKPQSGGGTAAYDLIKKNDDFARLMAGVVNDTAVLYTVVMQTPVAQVKNETVIPKQTAEDTVKSKPVTEVVVVPKVLEDTVQKKPVEELPVKTAVDTVQKKPVEEVVVRDSVVKATPVKEAPVKPVQDTVQSIIVKDTVVNDVVLNPPALPVIKIVSERRSDSGYHMQVVDEQKDTISIFIPSEKAVAVSVDTTAKAEAVIKKDTVVSKPPAVDTSRNDAKKLVMINSDCRSFAVSGDVDKLRVKLMEEKDAVSRINAAKKVFKTKCFSAQQIRSLSELFPFDEQKYNFFEAAYPFVSDTGNFKELVNLLSEPVYVQRFRRLVRLD